MCACKSLLFDSFSGHFEKINGLSKRDDDGINFGNYINYYIINYNKLADYALVYLNDFDIYVEFDDNNNIVMKACIAAKPGKLMRRGIYYIV